LHNSQETRQYKYEGLANLYQTTKSLKIFVFIVLFFQWISHLPTIYTWEWEFVVPVLWDQLLSVTVFSYHQKFVQFWDVNWILIPHTQKQLKLKPVLLLIYYWNIQFVIITFSLYLAISLNCGLSWSWSYGI
jgi:hypothetical protein